MMRAGWGRTRRSPRSPPCCPSSELPDFLERCAAVREGGSKIWAPDVPVNKGMQAPKHSRFMPGGIHAPSERTLQQFNVWLLAAYRRASQASSR